MLCALCGAATRAGMSVLLKSYNGYAMNDQCVVQQSIRGSEHRAAVMRYLTSHPGDRIRCANTQCYLVENTLAKRQPSGCPNACQESQTRHRHPPGLKRIPHQHRPPGTGAGEAEVGCSVSNSRNTSAAMGSDGFAVLLLVDWNGKKMRAGNLSLSGVGPEQPFGGRFHLTCR